MLRLLSAFLALSIVAVAQQPPTPPQDPSPQRPPTIRSGTNLVRVDVTVLGKNGDPVTDLGQQDFELEEDGVVKPLQSFQLVRASGFPPDGDQQSLPIRSPEHAAA